MPQPNDGKSQLDSQTQSFMLNFLRKKVINKIKCCRSPPDPDFLGVTISGHVTYFRFFSFSRHPRSIFEANELAVTGDKIFDYLKRKDSESRSKKVLILLITCELVSASMSIALFWWSQTFIFPLLSFSSVLLLKRSQSSLIAWTVTSTVAFYHSWSYTKRSDLWIRFVVYYLL